MNKDSYLALVMEMNRYDVAYWAENKPLITDAVYDQKLRQLQVWEKINGFIAEDSPTRRVGGVLSEGFVKGTHLVRMLSRDNIFEPEELERRLRTMWQKVAPAKISWAVEPKIDGLSLDLYYTKGVLTQALTRGNSSTGDDVTENVRRVRSVPLRLQTQEKAVLQQIHIRGEVFMTFDAFNKLNESRAAAGEEPMANPRNAASATLKMFDPKEVARRRLSFLAYHVVTPELYQWHSQDRIWDELKAMGFAALPQTQLCDSVEATVDAVMKFEAMKQHLPFPVDGAVIKVNQLTARAFFPDGEKAVRFAYAYKYAPDQVETKLKAITFQVGRSGQIAPVAELEPVEVAGSTVERATLHNADHIAKLDLRVGDTITLQKAGEVIPEIVGAVLSARTGSEQPIIFPTVCPCCRTALKKAQTEDGDGSAWLCPNTSECRDQMHGRIEHWCSKEAMDLQEIGPVLIDKLLAAGLARTVAGLYCLTDTILLKLPQVGMLTAGNALEQIRASKQQGLERVLIGLGIPKLGAGSAKRLARHFPSMQAILEAPEEELLKVKDFGKVNVRELIKWERHPDSINLLRDLAGLHVDMNSKTYNPTAAGGKLTGQTFVFTGEISMERSHAQKLVEDLGGRVTGSVSKKTTYVVVGDEPGKNKLDGAKKHSVKVVNETEFLKLLEE